MRRLLKRRTALVRIALALVLVSALSGCEQPLPPANPAPLQAAAEHFDVPVAVLANLQQTADRLAHSAHPGTDPPDVSAPGVERLRQPARLLEQRYPTAPAAAAP